MMVSYIDVFFLIFTALVIFVNLKKGLVVAIVGLVRFVVIIPLSYFLKDMASAYITDSMLSGVPVRIKPVIVFAIVFIVLMILSEILIALLKALQKKKGMPLRNINALLGGAFGLVKALIVVLIVSSVLACAVDFIPQTSAAYEPISTSFAVSLVRNINPLELLGGKI